MAVNRNPTRTLPSGYKLPTKATDANVEENVLALAKTFGDMDFFKFTGFLHRPHHTPLRKVRSIIAARNVKAAMEQNPDMGYPQVRQAVGRKFGFSGTGLTNWNKLADEGRALMGDTVVAETGSGVIPEGYELPTGAGSPNALQEVLRLADVFGDLDFFQFCGVLICTDSPLGRVRATIAANHVMDMMLRNPIMTYEQARTAAGKEFGYFGPDLSNWQRIADRGRDLLLAAGQWDSVGTEFAP